jgi:hypothetical protein
MPLDSSGLDATTQFLLSLRDRLTPENWRPYAVSNPRDWSEGRGCLIQQYHWVMRHAGLPYDSIPEVQARLKKAAGCRRFDGLAYFNDRHTLGEVGELVDKAIAHGAP